MACSSVVRQATRVARLLHCVDATPPAGITPFLRQRHCRTIWGCGSGRGNGTAAKLSVPKLSVPSRPGSMLHCSIAALRLHGFETTAASGSARRAVLRARAAATPRHARQCMSAGRGVCGPPGINAARGKLDSCPEEALPSVHAALGVQKPTCFTPTIQRCSSSP